MGFKHEMQNQNSEIIGEGDLAVPMGVLKN